MSHEESLRETEDGRRFLKTVAPWVEQLGDTHMEGLERAEGLYQSLRREFFIQPISGGPSIPEGGNPRLSLTDPRLLWVIRAAISDWGMLGVLKTTLNMLDPETAADTMERILVPHFAPNLLAEDVKTAVQADEPEQDIKLRGVFQVSSGDVYPLQLHRAKVTVMNPPAYETFTLHHPFRPENFRLWITDSLGAHLPFESGPPEIDRVVLDWSSTAEVHEGPYDIHFTGVLREDKEGLAREDQTLSPRQV